MMSLQYVSKLRVLFADFWFHTVNKQKSPEWKSCSCLTHPSILRLFSLYTLHTPPPHYLHVKGSFGKMNSYWSWWAGGTLHGSLSHQCVNLGECWLVLFPFPSGSKKKKQDGDGHYAIFEALKMEVHKPLGGFNLVSLLTLDH